MTFEQRAEGGCDWSIQMSARECSRQRNKWKRRACSVLDIFDSLVKKEAPYVHVTTAIPTGIYWHQILFSTEKIIKFIRNWAWLTAFSWGFSQEMEENMNILTFYTRVFWSSIGQIWSILINLRQDMSLFVLGALFCPFSFGVTFGGSGFGRFFVLFLREQKD